MDDELRLLEDFLMDIDMLDKLESKLAEFNVFETLNMYHNELRHSNVLAWLCKPNENHGLGDAFLRKLLQQIFLDNRVLMKELGFSMLGITTMELHDIQVMREWRNIDLTIISEEYSFILVIENKILSKESKHQLKKYLNIVHAEYPSFKKVFIYLTPDNDFPSDRQNWLILRYTQILDILLTVKENKSSYINNRVAFFLDQYIEILRRYFMGDNELEKICREIYFKHQKALDLIFEYKPDIYSEISQHLNELILADDIYDLDQSNKTYTRFITKELDKVIPRDGEGWTNSKRILLWEFQFRSERLALKLIIGPGNHEIREKIFAASQKDKSLFQSGAKNLSSAYTQIYTKEILPKNFINNYDDIGIIKDKINKKWNNVVKSDINDVENFLLRQLN